MRGVGGVGGVGAHGRGRNQCSATFVRQGMLLFVSPVQIFVNTPGYQSY